MEVLEAALEHKDVELADITGAAQGISHSCARPQNSYDRLIVKLAAVRGDVHVAEQELDEATSQSSDNTASQGRIADLQRKLAVEEDKVARLTKANKLLPEQRSASEADAEFFRARLSNLEAEVQESRVSNSRTQRDPKRYVTIDDLRFRDRPTTLDFFSVTSSSYVLRMQRVTPSTSVTHPSSSSPLSISLTPL